MFDKQKCIQRDLCLAQVKSTIVLLMGQLTDDPDPYLLYRVPGELHAIARVAKASEFANIQAPTLFTKRED